jgi:hypothetical protein
MFRRTCGGLTRMLFILHTRLRVGLSTRHSLRPLFFEGRCSGRARANRAAGMSSRGCLKFESIHVVPDKRAQRARSGTHNHRHIFRAKLEPQPSYDKHWWLWVPAFAGTTKMPTPRRPSSCDTPDAPRSCSPADATTIPWPRRRWRVLRRKAPLSASPPSGCGPAPTGLASGCS